MVKLFINLVLSFSLALVLISSLIYRWKEIQASLTASAVKNIPESLREIARQNRVMQREIALHKDEISETDSEIIHIKDQMK